MVAVNKQICKRLMDKGKFDTVMCELCLHNPNKCEIRNDYDDRMYELTHDAFDERRELAKEGAEQ